MRVEDLARNASARKQTDLVLLTFSKAFDNVNHSKLLWKLHQYGIRGNALSWIRAFFCGSGCGSLLLLVLAVRIYTLIQLLC